MWNRAGSSVRPYGGVQPPEEATTQGKSPTCRVPAVYLTWANVLFLTFFAFNEINKLRVISRGQNSDSPRLHHRKLLQSTSLQGRRMTQRQAGKLNLRELNLMDYSGLTVSSRFLGFLC
jgi:hypothetical protein